MSHEYTRLLYTEHAFTLLLHECIFYYVTRIKHFYNNTQFYTTTTHKYT